METPMNLLGILENGLFALGQVLRFPVMVLLWVCVAAVLFMAGAAVVDFLSRARERRGFDVERWLDEGSVLGAEERRRAALPLPLQRLLAAIQATRAANGGLGPGGLEHLVANGGLGHGGLEHLVLEHEERVRATASGARLLVKVGPSLGLLGTLIPMGTALAALATGNLEAMAGQMVVAFTTTIIGLACGTLAYVVMTVRQHWINEIVREQRFLAERVAAELALAAGGAAPAESHDAAPAESHDAAPAESHDAAPVEGHDAAPAESHGAAPPSAARAPRTSAECAPATGFARRN
jgi:hypothetical protein